MKQTNIMARLGLAFALVGPPVLAQARDVAFDLKVRAGFTAGDLRTHHMDNKAIGFGLGVRKPFGEGELLGELSFDLLPGQARDTMPLGGKVYAPAGSGLGTQDPVSGNPYFLRPNESIDLRKESSQGFSLKGGYAAPLAGIQGLTWQAGLSLDAYRVSSEFTGTLRPMVLVGGVPTQVKDAAGQKYYEGFATVRKGVAVTPGVFVGLRKQLADDFAIEANLRNIGVRHFDYRPTTYTGQTATVASSTNRGFVFDVALSLAF